MSVSKSSASPTTPDLELVNYGAGYAWLRKELDTAVRDADALDQEMTRRLGWPANHPALEKRYWLTDLGCRALAMEALFGPWPTLAEDSSESAA